jgi:uncharacterized protein (UPF0218 family)
LRLPYDLRPTLKKPLGKLVKGTPKTTVKKLKQILSIKKPAKIASVGDYVTKNLLKDGLQPDIAIVDNRIMREKIPPIVFKRTQKHVKNKAGTISVEALRTLERAIMLKKKLAIIVEGEEDLLVLPLMVMMPLGSIIIYGQPKEGMVIIRLTEKKRRWAKCFMEKMEEDKTEVGIDSNKI